ncbi:MAG TPA: hypothetical protein K8W01_19000 [Methylorubrum populi]|uniref:Flagellar basal-body protein FlbY n=1 Tax=Methylorubrum populi TaxID=223967 RepID=A0A921E5I5_9HYPH|nr:hypothetical protein [Methylorubrum populi]
MAADPATPLRLTDRSSALAFVQGLLATMDALEAVLARESDGVRAGRIAQALADSAPKSDLAAAYMNGLEAAKANAIALARFAPEGLEALKVAQHRFAAVVETNQQVLATARTVSESLIKTLAEEIGKARTPTVYGRPSHSPSPYGRGAGQSGPLVLSRSL